MQAKELTPTSRSLAIQIRDYRRLHCEHHEIRKMHNRKSKFPLHAPSSIVIFNLNLKGPAGAAGKKHRNAARNKANCSTCLDFEITIGTAVCPGGMVTPRCIQLVVSNASTGFIDGNTKSHILVMIITLVPLTCRSSNWHKGAIQEIQQTEAEVTCQH